MIDKIARVVAKAPGTATGAGSAARFSQHLAGAVSPQTARATAALPTGPVTVSRSPPAAASLRTGCASATATVQVEPGAGAAGPGAPGMPARDSLGARMVRDVQLAQERLDAILKLAESGRSFTAAELVALQAHAYRAGHELELAGKVVEKGLSAVKQTLQTQI